MSKKQNTPTLTFEQIEKGIDRNKGMIKSLFLFYAILFPICLVTTILMFVVGDGKYTQYGYALAILCVLCTVYVAMAYVRRKRMLNEYVRQQKAKNKK